MLTFDAIHIEGSLYMMIILDKEEGKVYVTKRTVDDIGNINEQMINLCFELGDKVKEIDMSKDIIEF